jgi:hypothetical protein
MGSRLADIPYAIHWVNDAFGIDPEDDNVDVSVSFGNGERYTATFFTVRNPRVAAGEVSRNG